MTAVAPVSVLHLTAATGGGVDRYIRDLAASVPRRHYIWHVGSGLDVIEDLASKSFFPLREASNATQGAEVLRHWLEAAGIGGVHVHGVDQCCRKRLALLGQALPIPWIATLHDLMFINPDAFHGPGVPEADASWIGEIAATLRRAQAIVVPSQFIRELVLRHLPGLDARIVAPGLDGSSDAAPRSPPQEFLAQRPQHIVAVVGAIGPHKGSTLLDALVAHLEGTGIGLVVIGYTDTELTPGWRVPGRYYVCGPYLDQELQGVLAGFGVDVALFPNRMPESFSYTLSEVWAAGIPAVVPDEGALGERVGSSGGGWRLPPSYTAADAARFLRRIFAGDRIEERARVKSEIDPSDPARVPSLDAMSREIDALYQHFGLPASAERADPAAARDALEPLLATSLDGFAFRKELIKLAAEVVELKTAVAQARPWAAKVERDIAEAQAWARKLEHDVETLTAELGTSLAENRVLADDKAAFDQLPLIVRKFLIRKAFRARR
jgi:glycosyltransferase involved in cell wall biosynthesis